MNITSHVSKSLAVALFSMPMSAFLINTNQIPLHHAAQEGHVAELNQLLASGEDVNRRDENNLTALHIAALNENIGCVKALLKAGASLNIQENSAGLTPLHMAIVSKFQSLERPRQQRACFIALLTAHLKREEAAQRNTSSFQTVWNNLLNIIGLSNRYRILDMVDNKEGMTPLHLASVVGESEYVKLLIDAGANKEACDNLGGTPLHRAVASGNTDCVSELVTAGANVNAQRPFQWRHFGSPTYLYGLWGSTPLHDAAREGQVEIMRILLDGGADKEVQTRFAVRPLYSAAHSGVIECVMLLLERGARVDVVSPLVGSSLHASVQKGALDISRLLLEHNATLRDMRMADGTTALHALFLGDIKSSLAEQVEQNARQGISGLETGDQAFNQVLENPDSNSFGVSRMGKIKESHVSCAQLLIDAGIDVNSQKKDGSTPLHLSVMRDDEFSLELTKLLLRTDAIVIDTVDKTSRRETPLHVAARLHNINQIDLLLAAGADMYLLDAAGVSALTSLVKAVHGPAYNHPLTIEPDPFSEGAMLERAYNVALRKNFASIALALESTELYKNRKKRKESSFPSSKRARI
jgi:ankyrin repeat protein